MSPPPDRLEAFREPVRAGVLLASALFIIGSRMAWVTGQLPYVGPLEVSGYDNAGDGAITLVAALATLVWALRRGFFESRQTVVVIFPLVIGVAALVITRVAIQDAQILIESWGKRGGDGSIAIGIWLTGLSALVMTIAGAVHVWRVRREVTFRLSLSPGDVGAAVGGVGGAILGGFAATVVARQFVSQDQAPIFASAQVAILLPMFFLGAWLGAKVGRVIGDGFRPMPPSGSSSTRA